jgi:hypothetical protein
VGTKYQESTGANGSYSIKRQPYQNQLEVGKLNGLKNLRTRG